MLVESFLRYMQYEKNCSFHTVVSYRNDLFAFNAFVISCVGAFDPVQIDSRIIRNWVVDLMQKGDTSSTVRRKVSALRSFFKYLVKQGVVSQTPLTSVPVPKSSKKLPSFLKESEMNVLFDNFVFDDDFVGVRDRLVLLLLYSTGMRRAELIDLRDENVDLSSFRMVVTGKRNKQRVIPFGEELHEEISRYLSCRSTILMSQECEALLVRETGEALYPQLVYRIVQKYLGQVTSLSKKSPHVLRHTFASVMLNGGAELNSVKELLGHSSLASTQVYTHIAFEELKRSYKQAHPRALRKGGPYGNEY